MIRPVCLLVLGVVLGGCKDKQGATPDAAGVKAPAPTADARPSMAQKAAPDASTLPDARPKTVDAAPAGSPDAEPPPPKPTGKTVGVAACDEYLDKMARCITRLSPESAEPLTASMEESRKAWQETAATNEGRAALADACKAALEAAQSAAKAMGCSW